MSTPEQLKEKQSLKDRLGELKKDVNIKSQKKVEEILRKVDDAPEEDIQESLKLIGELLGDKDQEALGKIIDAIHGIILEGGETLSPTGEALNQLKQAFPNAPGLGKAIEVLEKLQSQMAVFGSGVLKMLEKMFGGSMLGKLFGFLKDTPVAQKEFVKKALRKKDELTPEAQVTFDTDCENIAIALNAQSKRLTVPERKAATDITGDIPYDFVSHFTAVQRKLAKDKNANPTPTEFEEAGEIICAAYTKKAEAVVIPPAPAPAPTATPAPAAVATAPAAPGAAPAPAPSPTV